MSNKRNRGSGRSNNFRGRSTPYVTRSSTNSSNQNVDRRAVLENAYDNHKKVRPDPSSLDEEDMETDDQLGNEAETSAAGSNRNNNNQGSFKTTARDQENTRNGTNQKNLPKKTILTMQNLCSLADTRGLEPWHQSKPFQEKILNKRRNLSELFTPNTRDMQGLAILLTNLSDVHVFISIHKMISTQRSALLYPFQIRIRLNLNRMMSLSRNLHQMKYNELSRLLFKFSIFLCLGKEKSCDQPFPNMAKLKNSTWLQKVFTSMHTLPTKQHEYISFQKFVGHSY